MSEPAHLPPLALRGVVLDPPLFVAPMAGITHAAFRRLVADFGGYGALFTEMLPAKMVLGRQPVTLPYIKRRPIEGTVVYQLLPSPEDDAPALADRMREIGAGGLDVNLACPAPEVTRYGSGAALFRNGEGLRRILGALRTAWDGMLSVKVRLGDDSPAWRETLLDRLRLFESLGIDAVTVHPRFSGEKLKRRARWDVFSWLPVETRLPLIGNGDIVSMDDVRAKARQYPSVRGFMVGRMVVAQPWFFRNQSPVDHREVWERFFSYVAEDFPATRRLGKIKEFSSYFARNFFFGHDLYRLVQSARDVDTARVRAVEFLSRGPRTVREPALDGL